MTGTAFSDWWNATEGTIVDDCDTGLAVNRSAYEISDGTANESIRMRIGSGFATQAVITDGGVALMNKAGPTYSGTLTAERARLPTS